MKMVHQFESMETQDQKPVLVPKIISLMKRESKPKERTSEDLFSIELSGRLGRRAKKRQIYQEEDSDSEQETKKVKRRKKTQDSSDDDYDEGLIESESQHEAEIEQEAIEQEAIESHIGGIKVVIQGTESHIKTNMDHIKDIEGIIEVKIKEKAPVGVVDDGKCPYCKEDLSPDETMLEHLEEVHMDGKNKTCKICEKAFNCVRNTGRHMASVHDKTVRHVCKVCNVSFSTEQSMKRHVDVYHKGKKSMKRHLDVYNKGKKALNRKEINRNHQCPKCDKSYTAKSTLEDHMVAIHDKLKPYKCPLCDHRSSWKRDIQKHILYIHTKVKPYECAKCKMKFATKRNMNNHIKVVHDKVKNKECKVCGKLFANNTKLRDHALVHKTTRDHKCDQCSREFTVKSGLTFHIRTAHEGWRPNPCTYKGCEEKFTTSTNLKAHMKKVHQFDENEDE